MKWITAQDLDNLADNRRGAHLLPEIVRRLIRATSDGIRDIHFPSGESTFQPGYDGELLAKDKAPYVPDGASVWELSADKNAAAKAQRDKGKRFADSAPNLVCGVLRKDATYVVVMLRRWVGRTSKTDMAAFRQGALNEKVWKDVQVLDANRLEEWLENTPSVGAWLARELGIPTPEIRSLEDDWNYYRAAGSPMFQPALLLCGREKESQALIEAASKKQPVIVQADSPDEAIGFVAATFLSLDEWDDVRRTILSKALVIRKQDTIERLPGGMAGLYAVLSDQAVLSARLMEQRGHTVVAAFGNRYFDEPDIAHIRLPRANHNAFADVLVTMGESRERANSLAASCSASITVLRRSSNPFGGDLPAWANIEDIQSISGALFCNSWMHENEADKEVVACIVGATCEQVERKINHFLRIDDPPLQRAGRITALTAPADIWRLSIQLGAVSREMLVRFRDAAQKVLGERDPALELPEKERIYADLYGKKRLHSVQLCRGIVDALRLIAVIGRGLPFPDGLSAQAYVDSIVRGIPGLAGDFKTFASIGGPVAAMAEAAPDPFLDALEDLMSGDGSRLSPIFEGSDDAMFGRSYWLGPLRGLEVLAWDPDRLIRTTQSLARMAQLDPGGNLSNRPLTSLAEIFLPWNVHTNASPAVRRRALRKICEMYPDVGWELLSKLHRDEMHSSFGTARPEWREFGASQRPEPDGRVQLDDWLFVLDQAMLMVGTDSSRWVTIVKAAVPLGEKRLSSVLDALDDASSSIVASGEADLLWEKLRAFVAHHRGFSNAEWALPEAPLARIEKSAERLVPGDLVALNKHLFDQTLGEPLEPGEDFEDRRNRSDAERSTAVLQIARHGGIEAVMRLAQMSKSQGMVAAALVRASTSDFCREVVLAAFNAGPAEAWMAGWICSDGARCFGLDWAKDIVNAAQTAGATAEQTAALMVMWKDEVEVFTFVASKGVEVEHAYWSSRDTFVREADDELIDFAVAKMSEHGRNIELFPFVGYRVGKVPTAFLMSLLTGALSEALEAPTRARNLDQYWLQRIFDALRQRLDVDRDALMGLEYRWLPAIYSYTEPQKLALHEELARSPKFFVEVVCDLYKADHEVLDDATDSGLAATDDDALALRKRKAEIAYKVLDSWRHLPWQLRDGGLDSEVMRGWATEALRLAAAQGRGGVAGSEIGKLLAYAPADEEDGLWPTRGVRELLEALDNDDVERGALVELFNKRGVHSRPTEGGGALERQLEADSNGAAEKIEDEWPRTGRLLRANANQWKSHAEWEDRRAQEERIGR